MFKKQVDIERGNAESLRRAVSSIRNVLVKGLLGSMVHDSLKHAEIYESLISYLTASGTALKEDEYENLKNIVEEHIKIEQRMIDMLDELIGKVATDKKLTYILKYLLYDEYRHHALLKGILKAVIKKEVISEEEWWEAVWRDVISHGTPGG